jgi:hypothetical protein
MQFAEYVVLDKRHVMFCQQPYERLLPFIGKRRACRLVQRRHKPASPYRMAPQRLLQYAEVESKVWIDRDFHGLQTEALNRILHTMESGPFYCDSVARPRQNLQTEYQCIERATRHNNLIDWNGNTCDNVAQGNLATQICFRLSRRQRVPGTRHPPDCRSQRARDPAKREQLGTWLRRAKPRMRASTLSFHEADSQAVVISFVNTALRNNRY